MSKGKLNEICNNNKKILDFFSFKSKDKENNINTNQKENKVNDINDNNNSKNDKLAIKTNYIKNIDNNNVFKLPMTTGKKIINFNITKKKNNNANKDKNIINNNNNNNIESNIKYFTNINNNCTSNYNNINNVSYQNQIIFNNYLNISNPLTNNNHNLTINNSINNCFYNNQFDKYLNNTYNNKVRNDINFLFYKKMYYPKDSKLFRQYQFDIVKTCLLYNTLVCLPTGLGKTLIASVIMYNFSLWFKGKIFFFAPTKPLVNQQIEAFSKLFNRSSFKIAEITGKQSVKKRKILYKENKIFFMTPQTFDNDINNNNVFDNSNLDINNFNESISLLIFDEAHKATGNYAYSNIVNKLIEYNSYIISTRSNNNLQYNPYFRIIGLSASPGTNYESIQNVINSLRITNIELRTEQDEEVKKYTYNKKIQIAEIKEEDKQSDYRKLIDKLLTTRLDVMKKYGICEKKVTVNYLTVIYMIKTQEKFKENRFNFEEEYGKNMVSEIYDNFSLMFSLLHAKKMLLTQGVDSFKNSILTIETGYTRKQLLKLNCSKTTLKIKSNHNLELQENPEDSLNYNNIYTTYKKTNKNQSASKNNKTIKKQDSKARQNLILSNEFKELKQELFERNMSSTDKKNELHPKLKKLIEVINSNYHSLINNSKAIIFTQFKDAAKEIYDNLNSYYSNNLNVKNLCYNKNAVALNKINIVDINMRSKSKSNSDSNSNNNNFLTFEMFHGQDKNFKQKDQLEIMCKFRKGDIRVLISTSVAEEGLDIGDVDIIICYDMVSSSPIRMIQRFGRTGRKRDGVVIVLASQGEEKNKYFQCLAKLKSVNKELKILSDGLSVINQKSKINLCSEENTKFNLCIDKDTVNNVELFDLKEDVIDNADDFITEYNDLLSDEEICSVNNNSSLSINSSCSKYCDKIEEYCMNREEECSLYRNIDLSTLKKGKLNTKNNSKSKRKSNKKMSNIGSNNLSTFKKLKTDKEIVKNDFEVVLEDANEIETNDKRKSNKIKLIVCNKKSSNIKSESKNKTNKSENEYFIMKNLKSSVKKNNNSINNLFKTEIKWDIDKDYMNCNNKFYNTRSSNKPIDLNKFDADEILNLFNSTNKKNKLSKSKIKTNEKNQLELNDVNENHNSRYKELKKSVEFNKDNTKQLLLGINNSESTIKNKNKNVWELIENDDELITTLFKTNTSKKSKSKSNFN